MNPLAALGGRPVAADERTAFLRTYGHLFEHSPWVVERAFEQRPFADAAALHAALVQVIEAASLAEQTDLARAHPELADKLAIASGALTAESAAEQAGAGLNQLSPEQFQRFSALNAAYRARFGFPFIIAVRGQRDRTAILAALTSRVQNAPEREMATSLAEVAKIARFRLDDLIDGN